MTSDIRLRVGNVSVTIPLNGSEGNVSDAQVANVLRRFARSLGISTEGTPTENLTAVLEHIKQDIVRRSRRVHQRELLISNDSAINSELDLENKL